MTPHTLNINNAMFSHIRRSISIVIVVAFISTSVKSPAYAQVASVDQIPFMPKPGAMVHLSPEFTPAYLKGIVIHPENALKFDFIIYKGDKELPDEQKRQEYTKLTKYFLASLAIPDDDQWVNLSPYEKDRIIKDDFGKTEMGRDLLAQDYILKQITASLIYPEDNLGKKFWDRVYTEAQQQYGTTNIPVNTFNKVWILPDDALIYEKGNTAYVLRNHLKVMLEEDYLSLQKHSGIQSAPVDNKTHTIASKIVKEIVLPELEREVNEDKNFATVRQVYSGMLLAAWYKRALKESLLSKIYANKARVKGVDQDPKNNEEIYRQYLKAYKKGVFNYIKEDVDKYTNEIIPRKYFSGGFEAYGRENEVLHGEIPVTHDPTPEQNEAMLAEASQVDLAQVAAEEAPGTAQQQGGKLTAFEAYLFANRDNPEIATKHLIPFLILSDKKLRKDIESVTGVLNQDQVREALKAVRSFAEEVIGQRATDPIKEFSGLNHVTSIAELRKRHKNNSFKDAEGNMTILYKVDKEDNEADASKSIAELESRLQDLNIYNYHLDGGGPGSKFVGITITDEAMAADATPEVLKDRLLNNAKISKKYGEKISQLTTTPERLQIFYMLYENGEKWGPTTSFLNSLDIDSTISQGDVQSYLNLLEDIKLEDNEAGEARTVKPKNLFAGVPEDLRKNASESLLLASDEARSINSNLKDVLPLLSGLINNKLSPTQNNRLLIFLNVTIGQMEKIDQLPKLRSALDGLTRFINDGKNQELRNELEAAKHELGIGPNLTAALEALENIIDAAMMVPRWKTEIVSLFKNVEISSVKNISDSPNYDSKDYGVGMNLWEALQILADSPDKVKKVPLLGAGVLVMVQHIRDSKEYNLVPSQYTFLNQLRYVLVHKNGEALKDKLSELDKETVAVAAPATAPAIFPLTYMSPIPADGAMNSVLPLGAARTVKMENLDPTGRSVINVLKNKRDSSLYEALKKLKTDDGISFAITQERVNNSVTINSQGQIISNDSLGGSFFSFQNGEVSNVNLFLQPYEVADLGVSESISKGMDPYVAIQKYVDQHAEKIVTAVKNQVPLAIQRAKGQAYREEQRRRSTDHLVTADRAALAKGGIDFNAANLNLQIKRDGNGVPLPINQQNLENINIDGLIPIIIDIKPATSLPIFSELQNNPQSVNT